MILAGGAALVALTSACGATDTPVLPRGDESVELDPDDFTLEIDNAWMPLRPGGRWVYRVTYPDGSQKRIVMTVLDETREVMGIQARVVHEVETVNGEVVEKTHDWYAQDADGNVWYLGEDTKELENGRVSTTAGSWEAGVGAGQPGILFPARPEVGLAYRQEFYGADGVESEDVEEILRLNEKVRVPYGSFRNVVMTKDVTPDEPEIVQYKFYARGVGLVLAIDLSGGNGREELVEFSAP
jgi:hypothetical protein